jgi:hypothetical protein
MDVRQQAPLTAEQQQRWYEQVVLQAHASADPQMLLVPVLRAGELVAYGGLTNIELVSVRAEVSYLAEPERAVKSEVFREDFGRFLGWLKRLSFAELGLERLFAETYAFREFHIGLPEAVGFQRDGVLRGHVVTGGRRVDSVVHGLLEGERGE